MSLLLSLGLAIVAPPSSTGMGPPRPPLAEAIAAVTIAIHWVTYLSESEQAWTWRRPRHKSRARSMMGFQWS